MADTSATFQGIPTETRPRDTELTSWKNVKMIPISPEAVNEVTWAPAGSDRNDRKG